MRTLLFKTLEQKAADSNFYFSKEVKLILIIFFLANVSLAQIKTSKLSGGRWSDASTWVEGSIPGPGDAVTIVAGSSVVIRTSTDNLISNGVSNPANCTSLIVNGVLTLGSGGGSGSKYLNVSDFVTISNGGVLTNDAVELHRLNIGGNFTNNGTFNPIIGSGLIQTTFNGAGAQVIDGLSSTQTFYSFIVQKSGGALTTSSNVNNLATSFFTLTSGDFVAPSTLSSGSIILTAGTYTAGANTFLGGDFTNNGASFIAGTGTVTFNGSGTQTIRGSSTNVQFYTIATSGSTTTISGSLTSVVTFINGNLLIGDGTTFRVARPLTVKGTTTVGNGTSGKLLISSADGRKTFKGRVTVSAGGIWDNSIVFGGENAHFENGITNNGTFVAGNGLHYFEVNSQSIEGTLSIPNIDVATGVTLTNNGTFTVSNDLAGQGSLTQGNNAVLNVGGALGILSFSAAGTNNAVNYTGGVQTVKGVPYVNLGLSGNGAKTLTALTVTISGNLTLSETASATTVNNLTIGGNLSIGANTSLKNGVSRTLTVVNSLSGDGTLSQSSNSILNINGGSILTSLNASATGNTVNYNAASPPIIPASYHNLFLNQPGGNASLNGNTSVAGALTLNTGSLILGENNLTLGASAALSIASPSASRMIIASGVGELRRTFSSTGSFVFPIGDNTATLEYSPVTVNITSAAGFSSAYVGVSVVDAKHPSNASTTHFLSRYWNITQSGITTCVATISGTYLTADISGTESSINAAQLNGTFNQTINPWIKYASLTSSPMVVTGAILTGSTSTFTGITGANPVVTIGGDVAICSGSSFPLVSSVTGDPAILYSWSPAVGLSAVDVANPTATPSTTTTYTLTVLDGNGSSASKTTTLTVTAGPVVSTSSATLCKGATITASPGTGGTWVSNAPGIATIDNSGLISGISAGDVTFTFTLAGGCSSTTSTVTVQASTVSTPSSSLKTGTTMTASPAAGGTWVSNAPGVATIDNNGLITGISVGNVTFTFTQTSSGCSSTTTTVAVSADLNVSVPSPTLCVNATMTAFPSSGGTWVSNNPGVATIDNNGVINAIAPGTVDFTFTENLTSTTKMTSTVTVNALPDQKAISDAITCIGAAVNITLTGSVIGVNYQLRLDSDDSNVGTVVAGTGGDITFSVNPSVTTVYHVLATGVSTSCSLEMTDKSTVTVNALPDQKAVSDATTCASTAVNITLTGSVSGVNYQLRLDSDDSNVGTVVAGTGGDITFSVNPSETTVYHVLATGDATSCSLEMTDKSTVTVNALPDQKAIGDALTCIGTAVNITLAGSVSGVNYQLRLDSNDSNEGTAVAGTGDDITFSVNPSVTTVYNVLATVVATSCSLEMTSKSTVTLNALPATPSAIVTAQPTCTVSTGEIAVNSSLTGLSFSIDGTDFSNTTGVFTGLTPGNYSLKAKDVAGCISAASPAIPINVASGAPAIPTYTVTQPTCTLSTGQIAVTSTLIGISFSIDGSDFSNTSGVFTGLVAGNYNVIAKNGAGCITTSSIITINAQPATPAAPISSATLQPTCSVTTGTITVSSDPTGLSFSIDGSNYTNTTGVFEGLTPGDYTITAKNAVGCISPASSTIGINVQPATPSVNTPSAALCVGATMTVSPSTGGTWVSSTPGAATINSTTGLVTGVSVGTVTFTFTSTSTGCSNTTSSVTVSPLPGKPVITTSNILTDTPTLTSSSNTGNQWFKDNVAITGATSKTLTVSASGSYTVQVTTNGCSSVFSDAVAIVITGIEQRIISNRSAIYPNPAKEVIQIDWSDFASDSGIEIKIYDQVGRLIITKVMTSSDNSLDVRSLEQGSYVFMARQNRTLLIQRFIKN